jgi:uncharacterized membrane protein
MESIVPVLIVFVLMHTILKISFWKGWQSAIFGLVCGLFTIAAYPYAIEQTKTQIAGYLSDKALMQNLAALLTVEALICVSFCLVALRALYGNNLRPRTLILLRTYPGLMLFPALYYLLAETIFRMPGTAFATIAYGLAAAVALGLPAFAWIARRCWPEQEVRLELHLFCGLLLCIAGLISATNL